MLSPLRHLTHILSPVPCLVCHVQTPQPASDASLPGLCDDCALDVPWRPPLVRESGPPPDVRVVATWYEAPMTSLIYSLKYGGSRNASFLLARMLERAVREAGWHRRLDVLVPVPSHRLKRWSRGFDPVGWLAADLGAGLGLPVWPDVLRRVRLTEALGRFGADCEARRRAVKGAFRARLRPSQHLARIGLVDDLWTTGSTARTCTHALVEAGAGWTTTLAVTGNAPRGSSEE